MFEGLLNIPWARGGRDSKGLDCYGLAMEVRKRIGDPIPEYYSPDDEDSVIASFLKEMDVAEKVSQPVPFCFVAFRLFSPYVNHIGIVLSDREQFIHIIKGETVRIEKLSSVFWRNRIAGFYIWKSEI